MAHYKETWVNSWSLLWYVSENEVELDEVKKGFGLKKWDLDTVGDSPKKKKKEDGNKKKSKTDGNI